MKTLAIILTLSFVMLGADELSDAYQKEYTFLKAQKTELLKRVKSEKSFQNKEIKKAKITVVKLQNKLVELNLKEENIEKDIEKSAQLLEDKNSNKEISSSVLIQAKSLLQDYSIVVDDSKDANIITVMKKAFNDTSNLYKNYLLKHKRKVHFT